jgi:fatty acid-binding protein DegV
MHSSVLAEPIAHVCGLIVGIGVFYAAGTVTSDMRTRIKAGMIASSVTNLIIGGHINVLAKDFISLIFLRPISAYAGAKLFEFVGQAMSAHQASQQHA